MLQVTDQFGYVIVVGGMSGVLNLVLGGMVGGARHKAKVPYPFMYATEADCKADKAKYIFNCYQRAHQNFLENYAMFLFALGTGGIEHPVAAAVAGSFWLVGRLLYALQYQRGDPSKRNSGIAWVHHVGMLALLGMSLKTGVSLVMGV
ncbi:Microsomal glutathione S-transferase 3 [Entophlyctis luteolus]|nr:Microsomal glutathione S-transferase 3 [Entophlyctis luteolus]KAJ3347470.1 Microsomal glutathione S-transferase 3 [Entophlyctis luteolus]KAJ3382877.1 Microsomal glutathione S-transferase 3 [Entophlyctis sp. JEL0112]